MNFLKTLDRNELTYWAGLALLGVGLAVGVSVATALVVCGAWMAVEAALASYVSAYWSLSQKGK